MTEDTIRPLAALAGMYVGLDMLAEHHGYTMAELAEYAEKAMGEQDGTGTDEGGEEGDVRDAGEWGADSESD